MASILGRSPFSCPAFLRSLSPSGMTHFPLCTTLMSIYILVCRLQLHQAHTLLESRKHLPSSLCHQFSAANPAENRLEHRFVEEMNGDRKGSPEQLQKAQPSATANCSSILGNDALPYTAFQEKPRQPSAPW